jgi:hypothetical protein
MKQANESTTQAKKVELLHSDTTQNTTVHIIIIVKTSNHILQVLTFLNNESMSVLCKPVLITQLYSISVAAENILTKG